MRPTILPREGFILSLSIKFLLMVVHLLISPPYRNSYKKTSFYYSINLFVYWTILTNLSILESQPFSVFWHIKLGT